MGSLALKGFQVIPRAHTRSRDRLLGPPVPSLHLSEHFHHRLTRSCPSLSPEAGQEDIHLVNHEANQYRGSGGRRLHTLCLAHVRQALGNRADDDITATTARQASRRSRHTHELGAFRKQLGHSQYLRGQVG
eukprot:scaffold16256_cov105-Isochrysis_galbana.AAC.2